MDMHHWWIKQPCEVVVVLMMEIRRLRAIMETIVMVRIFRVPETQILGPAELRW